MEAMLMKEQARPGDETQFMHAVFTSEEEMLTFYLTLNRFANPVSYFMQRDDVERLENLQQTLGKFQHFTNLFSSYEARGIKQLLEGFGVYLMQPISKKERVLAAQHVGYQMKFLLDMSKDIGQAKTLSHILASHIQNVKYLLEKMKDNGEGKEEL